MYELPEVETVRRDLERELVGKKVKIVTAESMRCLHRYNNRKSFTAQLEGTKITGVSREGLFITIGLDADSLLVIDLGSTASLRRATNKARVDDGTEVVITFTQHGQLRFVDSEGTGEMFVVDADSLAGEVPEIEVYGIDPVNEPMSWTSFGRLLLERSVKLKTLLTDPTFVIGIGPIYADEILFHAGLRHDRDSDTLSSQEIRRLHRSLVGTLHDALKYRGTSLPERPFVDPFGNPGSYADHLEVWGRDGELSSRSRLPIKKVKFQGSPTYYCDTQV
ncbi:MAG: Fpg/Nei family DNA glycosylase [Acidimicrobiales bacterium]